MKRTIFLASAATAATHASPTIRGRSSTLTRKHSNASDRPAIKDERQHEKIRLYNESRRLQHQHQIDAHDHVHFNKKSRELQDSMLAHHTKSFSKHYAGTSNLHVKVQQGDDLGFQIKPSSSSSATTTTEELQPQSASLKYYPSFDMELYPNGACLNDGQNPSSYSLTPDEFLFDDHEECCTEWFIDVALCLEATSSKVEINNLGGSVPTSFPTWDLGDNGGSSPWPTWSDDVFNYEETSASSTVAETTTTQAATSTQTTTEAAVTDDIFNYNPQGQNNQVQGSQSQGSQSQNSQTSEDSPYTFYESFENGDFASHPWKLTTFSTSGDALSVDPWAADRTALAYEGRYAARPGILSEEGTVTNLTIALNDLDDNGSPDGVFQGGLLSFAIHAAVDMPMDALYFSINDHVIRTFKTPTGYAAGDWEEVSTLLLPGEHTLTWSYQFYGTPSDESQIDPRREGNSWIDDIRLMPYTGDYDMSEGELGKLDMSNGVAPWTVVQDPNAFNGDTSLIAYTQDVVSNQGSIEMSWTIVVSPDGGVVSFAAFASIYAPHDVLEFSIDNVPKVAITTSSFSWEEYEVEVDPGKHVCTWRLVKNVPGLNKYVIENVDVPEGYQGYAKVDGIKYEDDMKNIITTTEAPIEPTSTTSFVSTTTTEAPVVTTSEATSTTSQAQTTSVSENTTTEISEETTTSTGATETSTTTETTQESGSETSSSTVGSEEMTTSTGATETSTTAEATQESGSETSSTEAISSLSAANFEADGCSEGLQQVDGLPGCCVEEPNYLGDGACDPWEPYNTEACGFDLGDCCHDTCNEDSPYGCHTKEGADFGPFGFFCIDQRSSSIVIDAENCEVENREWIGDGGCDADSEYNTPECGYDGGDCCEDTCDQDFAFYTCGANQPYECLSEDR